MAFCHKYGRPGLKPTHYQGNNVLNKPLLEIEKGSQLCLLHDWTGPFSRAAGQQRTMQRRERRELSKVLHCSIQWAWEKSNTTEDMWGWRNCGYSEVEEGTNNRMEERENVKRNKRRKRKEEARKKTTQRLGGYSPEYFLHPKGPHITV